MRKFFTGLTVSLWLAACTSGEKKPSVPATKDTVRPAVPPAAVPSVDAVKISQSQLPASIKITGTMHEAWQWKDARGENILVTSYSPLRERKDKNGEIYNSRKLFILQYVQESGVYAPAWQWSDDIPDCMFDLACNFIPASTTITDIDRNGVAEIKVQYELACRSDVSPTLMKLVMQQSGKVYGLQGSRWIAMQEGERFPVTEKDVNLEKLTRPADEYQRYLQENGRYQSEREFSGAPAGFLSFARTEWLKFAIEKPGE